MSSSLLGICLHNKLWIEGETEIVITDSHFEVSDANEIDNGLWDWNGGHSVWVELISPWNDHVESVVEVVCDTSVNVLSLKVLHDVRLDVSMVHFDGVPLSEHIHAIKPHVTINVHIVILNRKEFVLEVLVPDLDFHAELDLSLPSIKNKTRCSQIFDAST